MKRITIILIVFLFNSLIASAKCGPGGIFIVGESKTLYKNSILVLEFYAMRQGVVPDIGNKYLVWLRSKNAKVALQPIEVLKGEMEVTEIVFRPTCDLVEGEVYELVVDGLKNWDRFGRYNSETNKFEPYSFTIVKNTTVNTALSFTAAPLETKKEMEVYGCGPARYVHFSIAADPSVKYVRANVKNKSTGKTTTYILTIKNGEVLVGHGMCSGAFHFEDSEKFIVGFALVDDAGNTGQYSAPIDFTKPDLK